MKLSEAIRIGAAKYPRSEGAYARFHPVEGIHVCALGAAVVALLGDALDVLVTPEERVEKINGQSDLLDVFLVETDILVCPKCNEPHFGDGTGQDSPLFNAITHLNDDEHETPKYIADWLERLGY